MWQKSQVKLLREEIKAVLGALALEPPFYSFVKEAITRTKYGLDSIDVYEKPWPLLPIAVCDAVSGHCERAVPAAAALHLIKVSAEIFDDTEDADFPESISARYGTAIAVNAATAFLVLAENTITRLQMRGIPDVTIIQVIKSLNSYLISACTGQHIDLSDYGTMPVSEKNYLHVLSMKSAFITECACKTGALLATTNEQLTEVFTTFGKNLGIASQIANDISGIIQGNDIRKRKITLPVIYALAEAKGKSRDILNSVFNKQSNPLPDITPIKELLFSTGAIHYASIRMETYKQKAYDNLVKAEKMKANTKRLKLYLE